MNDDFCHYSALAASKLPEEERAGFVVYLFEAVTGGVLLTGTWPQRTFSRGLRKGRPDYRSGFNIGKRRVMVTDEEYDACRQDRKAAAYRENVK